MWMTSVVINIFKHVFNIVLSGLTHSKRKFKLRSNGLVIVQKTKTTMYINIIEPN